MKKILFAASEVGSARALLPICNLCIKLKHPFIVTDLGFLRNNVDPDWGVLKYCPDSTQEMRRFLIDNEIFVLVFSVNITDSIPLRIARVAKSLNIPTIHLLDYWNGYSFRMQVDNKEMFHPSVYIVPDDLARLGAIEEGIDPETIAILGQPAFADAESSFEKASKYKRNNVLISLGLNPKKKIIPFVSEPVAMDYGCSIVENVNFKGYTERDAISVFLSVVKSYKQYIEICLLPHPRENKELLAEFWCESGGNEVGSVIKNVRGRELLPHVAGVAGMASTLLYESWLVGLPVISIQPGLLNERLRMLEQRDNVTFLDSKIDIEDKIDQWLSSLLKEGCTGSISQDIALHHSATENILELILLKMNDSKLYR